MTIGNPNRRIEAENPASSDAFRTLVAALILAITAGFPFVAHSLQYPPSFQFIEVPNPLSGINPTYPLIAAPVPAIGASFFDARFGTIQTLATRADVISGRHEYSRHDPFNTDQTMILLPTNEGDWKVYRTTSMPYNSTGTLVRAFGGLAEPRWDQTNPRLLWGLQDFSIATLDVVSGATTVVKNFANDATLRPVIQANPVYRITMQDEGEASMDRRYWAFMLQADVRADYQPLYVFTWDRTQNKVLGLYPIAANDRSLDWVGMSVAGNYVLIGGDPANTGTLTGLVMADRQLTRFHKIAYATAHADVGLDMEGKEVIVMQNSRTDYIDLIPIDWTTSPVVEASGYAASRCIPLIRLFYDDVSPYGSHSGVHVSCNFPGYAVVSTHIAPNVPEQNWLDRSLVLARLDRARPRVFYLAKLHNTTNLYWEETHASITNDGRKVVWADNWGRWAKVEGQEKMFLNQLDMPPNWTRLFRTAVGRWRSYP
jgi:hypothetical protein